MIFEDVKKVETIPFSLGNNEQRSPENATRESEVIAELYFGIEVSSTGQQGRARNAIGYCSLLVSCYWHI